MMRSVNTLTAYDTPILISWEEYFVSGFAVIVPDLTRSLAILRCSSTWPAAAYSLVVPSVIVSFGGLADVHGGRPVYLSGLLWLTMSLLVARLSKNEYMLDFHRALRGLGPAVFMPSGMALLSCYYWPGLRKYLVFIRSSSIKTMTVHHQLQPIYSMGLEERQG